MKIWFDCEFIENGSTIDLISIGMVREDGHKLYLESREFDETQASEWVRKNVFPHLGDPIDWMSRAEIATRIQIFAGPNPEFWAYYASYDWVALCQLYGTMMDLPQGWPKFCLDVQQERYLRKIQDLPPMLGTAHNALDDAVWTRTAWEFVMARAR